MKTNYKNVFDAHPKAQQIYVVGDMPFLKKEHAEQYAHEQGKEVSVIERPKADAKKAPTKKTSTKKVTPKEETKKEEPES